jgi:hypothetical protein
MKTKQVIEAASRLSIPASGGKIPLKDVDPATPVN